MTVEIQYCFAIILFDLGLGVIINKSFDTILRRCSCPMDSFTHRTLKAAIRIISQRRTNLSSCMGSCMRRIEKHKTILMLSF